MTQNVFPVSDSNNVPISFTDAELAQAQEIITHYPVGKHKSALLPLLHIAQTRWGWLSPQAMDYVANLLDIEPIEVYEVASFYTMFHLEPVGKYVLEVCRTGPCALCGAEQLIEHLENKLAIKVGQTTSNGLFTLKTVECLAACGGAPCLQVKLERWQGDYKYYENLSPEAVDQLIEQEWI